MNNFKNVLFHLFFENVISVCVCARVYGACVCETQRRRVNFIHLLENLMTSVKEPPSTKATGSCSHSWFWYTCRDLNPVLLQRGLLSTEPSPQHFIQILARARDKDLRLHLHRRVSSCSRAGLLEGNVSPARTTEHIGALPELGFCFVFKKRPHVAQAVYKLAKQLRLTLECWDYR